MEYHNPPCLRCHYKRRSNLFGSSKASHEPLKAGSYKLLKEEIYKEEIHRIFDKVNVNPGIRRNFKTLSVLEQEKTTESVHPHTRTYTTAPA